MEKDQQSEKPQRPSFKHDTFLHVLILIFLVLVIWNFVAPMWQATHISYSTFLTQVREDNIQEITVRGDRIEGNLQEEIEKEELGTFSHFVTYTPAFGDEELLPLLQEKGIEVYTEPERSPFFWYLLLSTIPLLLIALLIYSQYRKMQGGGGLFGIGKSQAKRFDHGVQTTTFQDVAGAKEAKVELEEVVDYLKDPHKIQEMGGKVPRGIMLVGPPGTGKTLLARAVAGEAGVPFFSITGSDFMEMFVGVGAKRVRNLFQEAKQNAPSIIYIDEIDAIGRRRGAGVGGGHDEREQTLNQLLSELDGFEPTEYIAVMTSTNRPDILDPALTRPGRFDRRISVDLPSIQERIELLQVHSRNKQLDSEVDLEKLARETPGFAGADLENLLNEAALLAARDNRSSINQQDIEQARDKILMGLVRHGLALTPEEKRLVAYHEAGHAVVGAVLAHAEPIHKVSIIPRSQSMGATQQFPEQEQYIYHKEYLLDKLAVLMGGRCAEALFFSTATSGAANDLQQATKMARKMVLEWGMSEQFEHMALGGSTREIFLGEELGKAREYSEHTAQKIDSELENILKKAYDRASEVLTSHREAIDELAQTLLDNDEVSGETVYQILEGQKNKQDTV